MGTLSTITQVDLQVLGEDEVQDKWNLLHALVSTMWKSRA